MALFIGVDGGGSKTTALLTGPNGTVLGRGSSGSSNYHTAGMETACASLDQALHGAFADAGLPPQPDRVKMACFGLAGVDRPEDQALLRAWAARQWSGMPVLFVNDAMLVLAAGCEAGWGVAVISGTGSIIYGRSPSGQTARAGGWGYLLGDEGSGYQIGLSALRYVTRAADGRSPQTLLTDLILDAWSLNAVEGLIKRVYREGATKKEIAALAAQVEYAALQGDGVAQEILTQAGEELMLGVKVVAARLDLPGEVPCSLAGGVLAHSKLVVQAFLSHASKLGLHFASVNIVEQPVLGAVRLARMQT